MKNLIKKSLLIVAVLTTMVMTGTELENSVNLKLIDAKLVNLTLQNSDGDLQVSIRDNQGHVLYSENFQGIDFSKKYDLTTLPQGEYFFEIEGQTKIKMMPFKVSLKSVEFENKIETVFLKPTVRRNEDLLFISKVSFKNEPLTIILYDENSTVLYKEELTGNVTLGKTLNLAKLNYGYYKLVMLSEDKVFTENIRKEK